jgi:hypothetical protein
MVLLVFFLMSTDCFSQELQAKDTIIKANGEVVTCVIKSIENDKVQYLVGGRFLTTTYMQRLSEIKFTDGSNQFIQPVLKITELDWEKVQITSDVNKVKNLFEKGYVTSNNEGSVFSNQEKLKSKSIEVIKREAAKLGAHWVLILESNNTKGNVEIVGDQIVGIRSGSKITGTAYGF